MAELLANVAIAGPDGLPEAYFLTRWRTVARALTTWRPLPPQNPLHDEDGNPTRDYQSVFKAVFGLAIDPQTPIVEIDTGKPTKSHRDDWARIP